MKTPSLIAAPGNAPSGTLADQAAWQRTMVEELDPVRRHGLGCMRSLADLMLKATRVKTYERDSQ